MMSFRFFAASILALTACSNRVDTLRLGIEGSLSCAPAFLAVVTDSYTKEVGLPVRPHFYGAGPSVSDALVGGELDAACLDPVAAAHAALRSKGKFVIIAGASSGGGALVSPGQEGAKTPEDLREARVFTPQAGSIHDVVARQAFSESGFISRDQGGEFEIVPASNLDALSLIRRRNVDAAWTGEPWVSLILQETEGTTISEQDDIWKEWGDRPDSTAVLLIRRDLIKTQPKVVAGLLQAHLKMIDALIADTDKSRFAVGVYFEKMTKRTIPASVFQRAWTRVRFSSSIPEEAVEWYARTAHRLGFFGGELPDLKEIFDGKPLKKALEKRPR